MTLADLVFLAGYLGVVGGVTMLWGPAVALLVAGVLAMTIAVLAARNGGSRG